MASPSFQEDESSEFRSKQSAFLQPIQRAWCKFSHIQCTEELASNIALKSQSRVANPLLCTDNQQAQRACEHFGNRQTWFWVADGRLFLRNFRRYPGTDSAFCVAIPQFQDCPVPSSAKIDKKSSFMSQDSHYRI